MMLRKWFLTGVVMVGFSGSGMAQTGFAADGIWLGTLTVGAGKTLLIQLRIEKAGAECLLDSVDQKAFGLGCSNLKQDGDKLSFDVPSVSGRWEGLISADKRTLTGGWSQGGAALALTMTRQTKAIEGAKAETQTFDAAMPPVPVAELKDVLDKDLAESLARGDLSPATHAGVTIGVVQHGVRRVWSYGIARDDSVYEIGSISKTFTATILAKMVEQKQVRLDEPVRELLPPGTVSKPVGAEITLLDLSDQHSGLPRMPDNFHPANEMNPYADYDTTALYAYVRKHGLALTPNAPFVYSNLGVGLLGQALSHRAGVPYPALLEREVTGPLGLKSTGVALAPAMRARVLQGYDSRHQPAHAWDLNALAGAGGIRSDAADMLVYLEAQLHPEKLGDETLSAAIAATHVVRADVGGGRHIALNWFRTDATGTYWHNGGTGGYTSYALFNPDGDYAIVVLVNRTVGPGSVTDALGAHVEARLTGTPAGTIP